MGLFKKKTVKLTAQQQKWNKMWELWAEEKADSPYAELMTYHSEINNGGHCQYFENFENADDIQKEMSQLEGVLPSLLVANLRIAYQAYLKWEENNRNKYAEVNLKRCDNTFLQNEQTINDILETYASKIE